MISERLLRKWRKEALLTKEELLSKAPSGQTMTQYELQSVEVCDRILRMTQELLDQHLLRRKS